MHPTAERLSVGVQGYVRRVIGNVKARWRQQMDAVLTLPLPYPAEREIFWRQALSSVACSPKTDWLSLAKQLKISGGEIRALAQAAVAIA